MKNILFILILCYYTVNSQNYKITYIEQYNLGIPVHFTSTLYTSEEGSLFLKDATSRKQGYKTNVDVEDNINLDDAEVKREQVFIKGFNEYTFYNVNTKSFSFLVSNDSNVFNEIIDTPNDIIWHLTNETKHIGEFLAYKATGNFRGREWEVWFTNNIPMPYGPWKLRSLPGLILEANEKTGKIYFSAIKIERTNDTALSLYQAIPKTGVELTYKEFVIYKEKNIKESFESRKNNLPRGEHAEIYIAPRNGIELIYEWEEEAKKE